MALRGVAAAVPDNRVSSYDLPIFTKDEAETFNKTVGIENRYLAPKSMCASDICQAAAEKLLNGLGWEKGTIDILLFASVTGDYRTPPTSSILQDRLGLSMSTFVMDIPMGCCGAMYAINIAGNLLSNNTVHRALLLVGDTAARMGSWEDKSRVPLFGDVGTAIALEYDDTADDIVIEFNTQGSGYKALMTPHGGYRHPIDETSFIKEDFGNGIIRAPKDALINGLDVFSFAISKPPISIKRFMESLSIDKDIDVDFFLIHQANKLIVDRIVKKLKLNPEKVPYDLQEFGNLGGASIPTLMVANLSKELTEKPLTLICSSFGLGLTWSTMLLKTKGDVFVNELIKLKC